MQSDIVRLVQKNVRAKIYDSSRIMIIRVLLQAAPFAVALLFVVPMHLISAFAFSREEGIEPCSQRTGLEYLETF